MTESRRRWQLYLYISTIILVTFVLLAYHYISTGRHLRYLEHLLQEKTGFVAKIGGLKIKADGLWIERLTLTDHDGSINLSVPLIHMSDGVSALMGRKRVSISLAAPVLSITPGKISMAEILKKGGGSGAAPPPFELVIQRGRIEINRGPDKPVLFSSLKAVLNIDKDGARADGAFKIFEGEGEFSFSLPGFKPEGAKGKIIVKKLALHTIGTIKGIMTKGDLSLLLETEGLKRAGLNAMVKGLSISRSGKPVLSGATLGVHAAFKVVGPGKEVRLDVACEGFSEKGSAKVILQGGYRWVDDLFMIDNLMISSGGNGLLGIRGSVKNFRAGKPVLDLRAILSERSVAELVVLARTELTKHLSLDGLISGEISIKGDLRNPLVDGSLYIKKARVEGEIKSRKVQLSRVEARVPFLFDFKTQTLKLREFRLDAEGAVHLEGTGSLRMKGKGLSASIDLKGAVSPTVELLRKIGFGLGEKASLGGELITTAILRLDKSEREGVSFYMKGKTGLEGLSFSSENGDLAGEGIGGRGMYEFGWLEKKGLNFSLQMVIQKGEFLAGLIYGDFSEMPVSGEIRVRGDGKRGYEIRKLRLAGDALGDIEYSGLIRSETVNGEVSFVFDGGRTFGVFRDAFSDRYPVLSDMDVSGGITGRFKLEGEIKRPLIKGVLKLANVNLQMKERSVEIRGLDLELPLYINHKFDETGQGRLALKGAAWGELKLKGIDIPIRVNDDEIILEKGVTFPAFGGEVILEDLYLLGYADERRHFHATVSLKHLSMPEITLSMGIHPLRGELSGRLPDLVFMGDNIYSDGRLEVSAFGGDIKIENLAFKGVTGPAPSFQADIEVDGLNLGELTETFDTGKISGLLYGYIRDLRLINWEPERFDLFLETRKSKNVAQKISVRALKKIQILGTGGTMGILDRGIYRLFKEYRYEKIGLKATLKNDILTLRGLEGNGGREYLVKGGLLPPKVDVVSYSQKIPFKELLRRLKRVKETR